MKQAKEQNLSNQHTSQIAHQRKHQLLQVKKFVGCILHNILFLAKRTRPTPTKNQPGCDSSNEPSEIDCEHGHQISSEGDKIVGVLIIKKCSSERFAKDNSHLHGVTNQMSSLVNRELAKKGRKEAQTIEFVKANGNNTHTEFHYSCDAKKEYHDEIKTALQAICKEKEVIRNYFKYTFDYLYFIISYVMQSMNISFDYVAVIQVHLTRLLMMIRIYLTCLVMMTIKVQLERMEDHIDALIHVHVSLV